MKLLSANKFFVVCFCISSLCSAYLGITQKNFGAFVNSTLGFAFILFAKVVSNCLDRMEKGYQNRSMTYESRIASLEMQLEDERNIKACQHNHAP